MSLLNRSARALVQAFTIEEVKNEIPFPANLEVEKEIVIAKLGSYVDIIKRDIIYGFNYDNKDKLKFQGCKISNLPSKNFNDLDLSSKDTEKDARRLYEVLKRKYNSLSYYQKNILYFYIKTVRNETEYEGQYEYLSIEYTLEGKFIDICIEDLMLPLNDEAIPLDVYDFFPYIPFIDYILKHLHLQEDIFGSTIRSIIYSIYNFMYDLFMNNYHPIKLYNPTEKELRDAEIARKE